jgi:hypothetical protein
MGDASALPGVAAAEAAAGAAEDAGRAGSGAAAEDAACADTGGADAGAAAAGADCVDAAVLEAAGDSGVNNRLAAHRAQALLNDCDGTNLGTRESYRNRAVREKNAREAVKVAAIRGMLAHRAKSRANHIAFRGKRCIPAPARCCALCY